MSGMCAIYPRCDTPVNKELLRNMARAMSHRGSVIGFCCFEKIGLGVADWHETDKTAREVRPFHWSPDGYWVAADVRLDNRAHLTHTIEAHGILLEVGSDAELIAAAYSLWGENCVDQLMGDFAFVLWDARQRRMIGVRSPSGLRPFFYHLDDRRLLCASEPRQLLEDHTVSRHLNDAWISIWLTQGKGHWDKTIYRDIQELLPGHYLIADRQRIRVVRFWKATPREMLKYKKQEEYSEHFRSLFFEAVRDRLNSDRPLLFDLSGGLDSSSIVCAAAEIWKQEGKSYPIYCFHIYSDQYTDVDEREYAQLVVRKYPMIEMIYTSRDENLAFDGAFNSRSWLSVPTIPPLVFPQIRNKHWRIASELGARGYLPGCFGDHLMCADTSYLR